jgi:prepilin peptidase CpaA
MRMLDALAPAFFAGLLLFAAASDIATMKIPNWVSIAMAASFPLLALLAGASWAAIGLHLGFGALALIACFALFQFGVLGGGDAKLIAAAAVWTGVEGFAPFALFTALAGGALTISLMMARQALAPSEARPAFVNRLLRPKGGVPYGVAIAAGGLAALAASPTLTLP